MLTLPQLTAKAALPLPASAASGRAGGAGGLCRGWSTDGVCCASTSTKHSSEQIPRLPPRSASQASWECARLSRTTAWGPCPGFSHERPGAVPGCPGVSHRDPGLVPGVSHRGPALSRSARVCLREVFPAPVAAGWVRTPEGPRPGSF